MQTAQTRPVVAQMPRKGRQAAVLVSAAIYFVNTLNDAAISSSFDWARSTTSVGQCGTYVMSMSAEACAEFSAAEAGPNSEAVRTAVTVGISDSSDNSSTLGPEGPIPLPKHAS